MPLSNDGREASHQGRLGTQGGASQMVSQCPPPWPQGRRRALGTPSTRKGVWAMHIMRRAHGRRMGHGARKGGPLERRGKTGERRHSLSCNVHKVHPHFILLRSEKVNQNTWDLFVDRKTPKIEKPRGGHYLERWSDPLGGGVSICGFSTWVEGFYLGAGRRKMEKETLFLRALSAFQQNDPDHCHDMPAKYLGRGKPS